MKRYIQLIFSFYLIISTAHAQTRDSVFQINGKIEGQNKGMIYLTYSYRGKGKLDSSTINDGRFTFSGPLSQPVTGNFRINDRRPDSKSVVVFLEPSVMEITLNNQPFSALNVKGSKTHEDLQEWKKLMADIKEKFSGVLTNQATKRDPLKWQNMEDSVMLYSLQKKQIELAFIKSHPISYVVPFILIFNYKKYSLKELQTIYNNMGPILQNSLDGVELKNNIAGYKSGAIGSLAVEFSGKDYCSGKLFSLSANKEKYTLIDFWGSWCVPCIALLPSISEEYQKYKKRNITFISVSVDGQQNLNKCKSLIKKNQMEWVQLWEDQNSTDQNRITAQYDIRAFPTTIIIDPTGKIIFRSEGNEGYIGAKQLLAKLYNADNY